MSVTSCDVTLYLNFASMLITSLALVSAWFNWQRASTLCLGVALLIQAYITLRPSCATILDLRGVPVVGQPAHCQPRVSTPAFLAGDLERVELADQVAEGDRAVAGHGACST